MSSSDSLTVTTVISKNYLAQARVLAASLARFHPSLRLAVLLCDEAEGRFEASREAFELLGMEALGLSDAAAFRRRYSRKALASASKPWLLSALLRSRGGSVLFLDPDVLVLAPLDEVFASVARSAITLTPHLLRAPAGDDAVARERNILLSGTFNAGFVGVSDRPEAHAFVEWWRARVERDCRHDLAAGIYYDQRWLDLAPAFFEDVCILRDPGCNVAHWNLPERRLEADGEAFLVEGRPLRFLHFSGFEPDREDRVTRYSAVPSMSSLGPASGLFRRYARLLREAGYDECIEWPSAFDDSLRSGRERLWRFVRRWAS